MSRHPSTKWAQRSDKLFITIELPDAKNVKLTMQPDGRFSFSATGGPDDAPYEVDLELHDKVNVEQSKAAVGLRNICYLVKKTEKKWWSRLLKQAGKPPAFLKVDWDKWIDEDDEEGRPGDNTGYGDMDFSKLNMGDDDEFDMDADNGEEDQMEEGGKEKGDKAEVSEASASKDQEEDEAKA